MMFLYRNNDKIMNSKRIFDKFQKFAVVNKNLFMSSKYFQLQLIIARLDEFVKYH